MAAEYEGDGQAVNAIFRPAAATWYVNRSSAGILIASFGAIGNLPLPGNFAP